MKTKKRILALVLAFCMIATSMSTFGYTAQAKEKKAKAGVVIDVTDFGADPTGVTDSAIAIQEAIEAAKEVEGPVTISFPEGRYDIYPDKAATRELYISNTVGTDQQYKDKKIGILLEGMKDVTVDGNGSLFMFHGKMMTFATIDCENVTFKNYEVDFEVPTAIDVTVEKVEGNTATVYVPECYNYEIDGTTVRWLSDVSPYTGQRYWTETNGVGYAQLFDAEQGRTWRIGGNRTTLFDNVRSIEDMGNQRLEFTYNRAPGLKAGQCYQMRTGKRDHAGTFFWKSKDIRLENLDIRFLHGFGMVGQFSENITLDDVDFEVDKSSGRTTAGYADFIQMSGCKGLIDVSGCTFSNPHDDPINIHGTFLQVKERITDNKFKVEYRHNETAGFPQFFVGDEVEFMTQGNMIAVPDSVAKVTAVEGPTGDAGASESGSGSLTEIIITLDKDMPAEIQAGRHVVENITYTPSVSIKNNIFKETPTRGILCTTRKPVVIENNTFDGMGMASIFISNDAQGWYESGPTRDVTIKNNVFTRCQSDAILVNPTNPTVSTSATVHDNMKIIGNTFYLDNRKVLNAKSVSNLTFKDNTIYRPEAMKDVALTVENDETDLEVGATAVLKASAKAAEFGSQLFRFNGCKNVLIQGNKYDGGLNAGSSISNMSASDITVEDDIAKVNADSKTNPLGKVVYVSNNEKVVKVSDDGIVTAVGEGTATVSAYFVVGGRKFEANDVTFTVAGGELGNVPTGVTVTAPVEKTNTEAVQFTAEVAGEADVNKTITWSVVDATDGNATDKAVINENGLLTPQKSGVVEVVATTVNGLEARKLLVIQQAGIALSDDYEVLFPNADTMEISGEDQVTLKTHGQGLWGTQKTNNIVVTNKGAENVTAVVKMDGKTKKGYDEAGFAFYKDNDNYVALQRKHAGGNPGIKVTNEANGSPSEDGVGDAAESEIYLKLEKTGDKVVGFYSVDGTSWTKVREVTNASLGSEFKIGLVIGAGSGSPKTPFVFSELTVDGKHVPFTKAAEAQKAEDAKVVYTEKENKLEAEYKVVDGVSAIVKWAAADKADGAYSVIEGMTGKTVTATSELTGKFVKAAVIPVESGMPGEITWTDAVEVTGEGSDAGEVNLKSSNAWLKTADVTGVTFDTFNTTRLYYFATATEKQIGFNFEAASDKATVVTTVNGKKVDNNTPEYTLEKGRNEIEVTVTAEDNVTFRYHRFIISKTEKRVIDRITLEKLINEAKNAYKETDYTSEAWNVFQKAIAKAQVALDKDNSTPEDLSDAYEQLREAISELLSHGAIEAARDLPVAGMRVTAGSEETSQGSDYASNVLDGNTGSIWHTDWDGTPMENRWIDIALAEPETVGGVRILARSGVGNGMIKKADIYVKTADAADYVKVAENAPFGQGWQQATFTDVDNVTNVKIQAVETQGDWASAAEIRIMGKAPETEAPVVDKTDLQAAVDAVKALNKADYTAESWAVLEAKLAVAEAVLANAEATDYDVLLAAANLENAVNLLEEAVEVEEADKTWLAELIEYADSQKAHEDYKYVVPVVKAAFEKALAEAVAVNEDANATQEEVDAAYDALLNMVHYLTFTGNSESLVVLVDAAKGLNEKLYTTDSWAALKDALEKAEAVLADENALQAEIDVAREVLQAAMEALVKNPVDKSKLAKLVEKAKKYEDKIADYTPATAEIFEGALAHAKDVLENEEVTQEEIDAAYAGLQNAIFGLRLIPNKDKLEDLIKDAKAVDTANYTAESAAAFTAALTKAEAVFADANATEEDVKAAEKALKKAQKNLVAKADADKKGNDKKTDDKVASGNGSSKPANKAAKTGDESNTLLIMMAILAAGVIGAVLITKKIKK